MTPSRGGTFAAIESAMLCSSGASTLSRIGNNPQLLGLNSAGGWHDQKYFAIMSDFRPPVIERWKFCNAFCDPKSYALDWVDKAADLIILERKAPRSPLELSLNDMVVDCSSMIDLGDLGNVRSFKDRFNFGQSSEVMQTNCFLQKAVHENPAKWLWE